MAQENTRKRERLLTPETVADYLSYSTEYVRFLLRKGEIRGRKLRGGWRVTESALDEYIESHGGRQ
jgi:excisionase family DNA binding protein